MCKPCDTGMCNTMTCSEYDECLAEVLHVPSAGIVPESIKLPQELQAYNRGASQYAKEKATQ